MGERGFMASQFRQKRKELVNKALAEDSDIAFGKRFATVVVILWVSTRVLQLASTLLSILLGSLIVYSLHNVFMLLVIAIYLWALFLGFRWTVVFPVFMGGLLVMETFRYNLYYVLISERYALDAHLYALTYIVAAYGQILFSILLAASRRSRLYFDTVNQITQRMQMERLEERYKKRRHKKK